jgi:hypothetical protein
LITKFFFATMKFSNTFSVTALALFFVANVASVDAVRICAEFHVLPHCGILDHRGDMLCDKYFGTSQMI